MGVVFLPSVCDGFCVSVFSLGQGSRRFCHELYGQSTVVFCKSGRDACFTIVGILCADHVFWYPWFLWQELNSFDPFSGLHANIVEEYVLLSALLHDQSSSREFSMFSASVCVAPFFSNLCLQGWVFFSCTWEHESRVFEPALRCCVTRA